MFVYSRITTPFVAFACASVASVLGASDEAAAIYVLHFALKLIDVFVALPLHYAV